MPIEHPETVTLKRGVFMLDRKSLVRSETRVRGFAQQSAKLFTLGFG